MWITGMWMDSFLWLLEESTTFSDVNGGPRFSHFSIVIMTKSGASPDLPGEIHFISYNVIRDFYGGPTFSHFSIVIMTKSGASQICLDKNHSYSDNSLSYFNGGPKFSHFSIVIMTKSGASPDLPEIDTSQ